MSALRLDHYQLGFAGVALATLAALSSCGTPVAAETKAGAAPCPPTFPIVPLPTIVPWNGAPLPTGPHSVIIVQQHAQYPGDFVAYQVEWTIPSIPRAVLVPSGKLPTFVDTSILASILIVRPLPPPPPVVDPILLLQESRMVEYQ